MNAQASPFVTTWFPILFPLLFVGMWLVITTMLGAMSGWYALQRRYPRGSEAPLRTFRRVSGSMGRLGVSMGGILSLAPTATGLRVGIFRLFGPFQRPFDVPWRDITVERGRLAFLPRAKLTFGSDERALIIGVSLWNRIAALAPESDRARLALEPIDSGRVATAMLAIWVAGTALFGTFIVLGSRAGPQHAGAVPVLVGYGMAGLVLAIPMVSLWFRELR